MTKEELCWLAGLLEGEGSFSSYKNTNGRAVIRISLHMKDEDIVRKVWKLTQVGLFSQYTNLYGPIYVWDLRAQKETAGWMMMLYPLMGERRQKKIKQMLLLWRSTPIGRKPSLKMKVR